MASSESIAFKIPGSAERFRFLTAGEFWYLRLSRLGAKQPRGRLVRRGKERFASRVWADGEYGVKEYLPADKVPLSEYEIYIGDRESARVCGDPLLGVVLARCKTEAELKAARGLWDERTGASLFPGAGLHAKKR